ncbi:MAG: RluA family pseudouridine synthase [Chitinophagaceae bacterium]
MIKLYQEHILQETEDWIAIQKWSGIATIPEHKESFSIKSLLQEKYPNIFVVHRLDKETSGVVLFAKNATCHKILSLQFQCRTVQKEYLAIVEGSIFEKEGSINMGILPNTSKHNMMIWTPKGKPSVTNYTVLEDFGKYSLVKFIPLTGRTHQIRVHAKYIKHAIVCDTLYGNENPIFLSSFKSKYKQSIHQEERPLLLRLGLHASLLQFTDHEKNISVSCRIPKDMNALLQQLRKRNGRLISQGRNHLFSLDIGNQNIK